MNEQQPNNTHLSLALPCLALLCCPNQGTSSRQLEIVQNIAACYSYRIGIQVTKERRKELILIFQITFLIFNNSSTDSSTPQARLHASLIVTSPSLLPSTVRNYPILPTVQQLVRDKPGVFYRGAAALI